MPETNPNPSSGTNDAPLLKKQIEMNKEGGEGIDPFVS
jgi:hypothetical protein